MGRVDDLMASGRDRPLVMGILNVTPDSFFDGGRLFRDGRIDFDRLCRRAETLVTEGADLLDIGGESTRPGATCVSIEQELDRVVPVVDTLARRFDVRLSVDTSAPAVMTAAAAVGASMINDVRALCRPGALQAVASAGLPVCLMHTGGEPATMQDHIAYHDVVVEVSDFLRSRMAACVEAGIDENKLLVDPGFGFGKSLQHNLELFRALPRLASLGVPLMIGVSRKSMIGALLDRRVEDRMLGSVVLAVLAAQSGAQVLRVHDVGATVDALKIMSAVDRA